MPVGPELDMLARDTMLLLGESVVVTFLSGRTFTATPGETSAAAQDLAINAIRGPLRAGPSPSLPGRANTMLTTDLVVRLADLASNLPKVGDTVMIKDPGEEKQPARAATVTAVESEINGRHVRLRVAYGR